MGLITLTSARNDVFRMLRVVEHCNRGLNLNLTFNEVMLDLEIQIQSEV